VEELRIAASLAACSHLAPSSGSWPSPPGKQLLHSSALSLPTSVSTESLTIQRASICSNTPPSTPPSSAPLACLVGAGALSPQVVFADDAHAGALLGANISPVRQAQQAAAPAGQPPVDANALLQALLLQAEAGNRAAAEAAAAARNAEAMASSAAGRAFSFPSQLRLMSSTPNPAASTMTTAPMMMMTSAQAPPPLPLQPSCGLDSRLVANPGGSCYATIVSAQQSSWEIQPVYELEAAPAPAVMGNVALPGVGGYAYAQPAVQQTTNGWMRNELNAQLMINQLRTGMW